MSHGNNICWHFLGIMVARLVIQIPVARFLIFVVGSYSYTFYLTTLIPTVVRSYSFKPQKNTILNMGPILNIEN